MSNRSDFLIDHSYKKLWQSPGQDIQHIVSPKRVTPRRGALGKVMLGMKEYNLPSTGDWYSVFVFGDIPHFMVGVDEYINKWVSAEYHCNVSNTLITIYDNKGMTYPCFEAYFLYTRDGQVAIALKNHQYTINVLDDDIFIKWRSSSWFNDVNNLYSGQGIVVRGRVLSNTNDINTMSTLFTFLNNRRGYVWAYKNGRRIHRVHSTLVSVGDRVEIVWDGSVREVIRHKLKDLPTFDSTMDKKSKYLVYNFGYGFTVDYHDDVDAFILEHKNENEYDGVYYHHNQPDAIRNITHRDFSVPTSYVVGIIEANVRWNLANDNRLEVLIRHSGWIRDIPNVHVRMYELFRLNHSDRLNALIGEHSLITEWTADNLESSTFNELMSLHGENVSLDLATDVFRYNATSLAAGKVVHYRDNNVSIKLGHLYHYRATVYEYNQNGKMLGHYKHSISPDYYPRNPECAFIEVYFGWAGPNMGTVFGKSEIQLDDVSVYRFYIAYKMSANTYGEWSDVTGDETKYNIDPDGKLIWLVNPNLYLTAVRKDCDFLAADVELDRIDRLLLLSVQTDNVYQDKGELRGWLEIPPGELDVFLNGYHLVQGIDYHVNWPEICIVNTTFRSPNILQKVHVRARGLCGSDMKISTPKDYGFVYNRKLARRDRYTVMEDKSSVIHSNGRLIMDSTAFTEDWSRKELPSGFNGKPFQIRHPVIPLKNLVSRKTDELYNESVDLDNRIEGYLTDKLGIEDTEDIRDIDNKYIVVSPFMNKLLHDLLNGIFPIDEFIESYSDEYLLDKVSRYNYLLEYEPTRKGLDTRFMEVHPHPYLRSVEVNVYQYRILDKISKLVFKDNVALDKSLLIIESGFEHDA